MAQKFYLTKKGLAQLKREYQKLKTRKLALLREGAPPAFHSEEINPEYLAFKEEIEILNSKIEEIEQVLKNYRLIKLPPKSKRKVVDYGATVTLVDEEGKINEVTILSPIEANPNEGKISAESPLGKALLGKKVGEEVELSWPSSVKYKIKKIKYLLS